MSKVKLVKGKIYNTGELARLGLLCELPQSKIPKGNRKTITVTSNGDRSITIEVEDEYRDSR